MLPVKPMRRLMQLHTERPISQKAVDYMLCIIELFVKDSVTLSDNILKQKNILKEAQKLRARGRLSELDIEKSFEEIFSKNFLKKIKESFNYSNALTLLVAQEQQEEQKKKGGHHETNMELSEENEIFYRGCDIP